MKKHLEYKDEKSHKFWEYKIEAANLIVTYGKFGTKGQTRVIKLHNNKNAIEQAGKITNQKLKQGYTELKKQTKSTKKEISASTIKKQLEEFIKALNARSENVTTEDFIFQPINTNKATAEEIAATEKKLVCSIPEELKNYYINGANGSMVNENKYPIYEILDVFSHQKIMGIYDYFKYYWEEKIGEKIKNAFNISEKQYSFMEKNNKEYFVCIVKWNENFLETFAFDNKGDFYRFNYDQDLVIDKYIEKIINFKSNNVWIKKDNNLGGLLKEYLEGFIVELDEMF